MVGKRVEGVVTRSGRVVCPAVNGVPGMVEQPGSVETTVKNVNHHGVICVLAVLAFLLGVSTERLKTQNCESPYTLTQFKP